MAECEYPGCDFGGLYSDPRLKGKKYCQTHRDAMIRGLVLNPPTTSAAKDASISRAFKKLRSALRERARIYNKFIKHHLARTDEYKNGLYKTRIVLKWGQVLDIADQAVRDAVKEMEMLI